MRALAMMRISDDLYGWYLLSGSCYAMDKPIIKSSNK